MDVADIRARQPCGAASQLLNGELITPASLFAWAECRAATRPRGGVPPPTPRWSAPGNSGREVAYRNGEHSGKAFVLPVHGGAAGRTEVESQRVVAFGRPLPRRRFAAEGDLLAAEPRLVADDGAGAALALQAMTHRDARWFALDREVKLPATAGGASGRHGVGSVAAFVGMECRPILDHA